MSDPLEESDEIVPEGWPIYFTPVPVWLLLAGTTAQAYRMYAFLAEHINRQQPGERITCPKQTAIARVLQLKNAKQVGKYGKELESIGALRIEKYRYGGGMRSGYRYYVRFHPPTGYVGPISLPHFYEANPDLRSASSEGRTVAAVGRRMPSGGTKNSPPGGTKNSPSQGPENSTSRGAVDGPSRGTPASTPQGTTQSTLRGTPGSTSQGAQNRSAELEEEELEEGEAPPPPVETVAVPRARAARGEEEALRQRAVELLQRLPDGLALSGPAAEECMPHLVECLAGGWPERELVERLGRPRPSPMRGSVLQLVAARLAELHPVYRHRSGDGASGSFAEMREELELYGPGERRPGAVDVGQVPGGWRKLMAEKGATD